MPINMYTGQVQDEEVHNYTSLIPSMFIVDLLTQGLTGRLQSVFTGIMS
jgi:hypothetical protein